MAKSTNPATVDEQGNHVVNTSAPISDEMKRGITSFDDAVQLAAQEYGEVEALAEYIGDGFEMFKDKNVLVDEPFLLLEWSFYPGKYGDLFVTAIGVTKNRDKKFRITDGSTGIADQLMKLSDETHKFGGFIAERGLRVSEYDTCMDCGKPRDNDDECENCGDSEKGIVKDGGATFYLNT